MTEQHGFTARDRVLVVAPHPDDEAIATGGALQVARSAGAACRVLVITDGDNNPWPQRWIEKRWHIGGPERARWGAQRRQEALAALEVLGVRTDDARCFGFPDLGLTDLLMAGDGRLDARVAEQLDEFAPTRLFLPALADRHPDHSALHVLLRLALLRRPAPWPRLLTFGVHGAMPGASSFVLELTPAQQDAKRAAIMRHETQMRLSRRRFVAYARRQEPFGEAEATSAPQSDHPVSARIEAGRLGVHIDRERFGDSLRGQALLVVALRSDGVRVQRRIDLQGAHSGRIVDTATNRPAGSVELDPNAAVLQLAMPVDGNWSAAWIKLSRTVPGLFVLDRFGWQTIDCGAS